MVLPDGNGRTGRLLVNLELMKAGYPPIDIKFTDRLAYYNAFDEYHVKHNLDAMEKLFAGYVNTRLENYLEMLEEYGAAQYLFHAHVEIQFVFGMYALISAIVVGSRPQAWSISNSASMPNSRYKKSSLDEAMLSIVVMP